MRFLEPTTRLHVLFTLILFLIGSLIIVNASAQSKDRTPQAFGVKSIAYFKTVNLDDTVLLVVECNKDMVEIISVGHETEEHYGYVEHFTELNPEDNFVIALTHRQEIYIRTKDGVTSIFFFGNEKKSFVSGDLVVNGALRGAYENGEYLPLAKITGRKEDEYKNKIKWAYDADRVTKLTTRFKSDYFDFNSEESTQ